MPGKVPLKSKKPRTVIAKICNKKSHPFVCTVKHGLVLSSLSCCVVSLTNCTKTGVNYSLISELKITQPAAKMSTGLILFFRLFYLYIFIYTVFHGKSTSADFTDTVHNHKAFRIDGMDRFSNLLELPIGDRTPRDKSGSASLNSRSHQITFVTPRSISARMASRDLLSMFADDSYTLCR